MRQYNLVLQPGEKEVINESDGDATSALANRSKEARGLPPKTDRGSQLALAQFLYAERIREIQESIKIKEQKFKALAADIEALNSGALDAKLSAEVTLINSHVVTPVGDANIRPPPKDRSGAMGPASTTPGGSTRTARPTRSDSSTTEPDSAARHVQMAGDRDRSQDVDMRDFHLADSEHGDDTVRGEDDEVRADEEIAPSVQDDSIVEDARVLDESAPKAAEEEKVEEEKTTKSTRSSKRKRESDAGLKKQPAHETKAKPIDAEERKREESIGEAEGDIDMEEEDTQSAKEMQPRRSRRSGRGVGADEEVPAPIAAASAVTSSTKNRLEALRSRETSGASQEGEEEGESAELDTSRSTIDRGSRTSISPISHRRGRGTSRLSGNVNASRRSRGASNTSRNEAELTDAERDRIEKDKAKRKNEKVLMMLLNDVSNHTHGNLFHSAIKEQDAPDYYALIRHPLDLKTIKMRIKEGIIVSSIQLRRALNQMFANSLIYNRPGTEIHRMALEMRDAAEEVSLPLLSTMWLRC